MQRLTERLERIVPKPMRAEPTMSTPIAAWTCACRVRVRRARDAVATEDAQERELMRAVDDAEREERERRERQEQQEHERDERVRAAAAEYQRRAHLENANAVHRWQRRRVHHGEREHSHLTAIHRADHIMQVGQRYVDGRHGCNGAQFINTDLVATVDEVARRLAEGGRPTHVEWEVESALSAGDLRCEWAGRCRSGEGSDGTRGGRRRCRRRGRAATRSERGCSDDHGCGGGGCGGRNGGRRDGAG
mmetsp:Transcript_37305/g.98943  ORF Transcript_37305/g.98943 Transcript_37305/m.98943 type:complete len:248 (+) Transcript_37305:65-808(+)